MIVYMDYSIHVCMYIGFPCSSADREFTCNAGDPSSTLGSGSSPGEGIGYLLQYSWASMVAQLVKNLLAIWETWVWSLGWEDPLEEGMATHSSILAWRIPMDRGVWWATARGTAKSWTLLSDQAQHSTAYKSICKSLDDSKKNVMFYQEPSQKCRSCIVYFWKVTICYTKRDFLKIMKHPCKDGPELVFSNYWSWMIHYFILLTFMSIWKISN